MAEEEDYKIPEVAVDDIVKIVSGTKTDLSGVVKKIDKSNPIPLFWMCDIETLEVGSVSTVITNLEILRKGNPQVEVSVITGAQISDTFAQERDLIARQHAQVAKHPESLLQGVVQAVPRKRLSSEKKEALQTELRKGTNLVVLMAGLGKLLSLLGSGDDEAELIAYELQNKSGMSFED